MYESLYFNKVADLACNFIKIETLAQVFSCEFCEISKNNFSYRLPPLAVSAACNFIKKEIPAKMFFCEFGKISKNDRALPDDCFLSVNFEKLFRNLFYRAPLRNCLFHVQVAVFQPADTVKKYFTGVTQTLYTRRQEVAIRGRSFT